MQTAAFSINNYRFDKVNIDLSNHKSNDLSLSFNTKGLYLEKDSKFELTFEVKVFNKESKENPFVTVQCIGLFDFENVTNFDEIPNFFYRNSIAILFPYLRAYVSLVTNQANIPAIILPTLNLSHLEGDLKSNTSKR
ncbi:protein-export chaperone SecB [Wenyingzhuangia sp. 2_MG-2023]|uniref:protein-export chaperone SecB n=1 Tax=Wenyingzhuangia sp. 2_MG-2023 TaxID=3062639 RepID=UPI0026E1AF4D|nr:protein-export chaperone SecB [Wenyingzhuangia sp. 2_MG-2023]MDO6738612.1 protein-export chaperone SecB [Wenyingzhuangia sp. 2_MG-2023]